MITFDDFTAAKLVFVDKSMENHVLNGFQKIIINPGNYEKTIEPGK